MSDPRTESRISVLIAAKDTYPPFRVDVVELFCNGLAREGLVIDWFMIAKSGQGGFHEGPDGQRFFVAGEDGTRWLPRSVRRAWNMACNRLGAFRRALFGRYDIVQVRDLPILSPLYLLAARVSGKKFVYWMSFPMLEAVEANAIARRNTLGVAGYWTRIAISKMFGPLFYKIVLNNADHVFVQSDRMREYVDNRGVTHGRVTPVPMCVQLAKFGLETIPPHQDVRMAGRRVLVYSGATEPVRRVDEMIRALSLLVRSDIDVVLFILGGGRSDDREALNAVAEEECVAERVFFTGHLPLNEALSYVRRADVCLSPYPTDFIHDSGTPTKLVEYLAMGRPVVANLHPDQEAIMKDSGIGACVPLTAQAFADAAAELLSDTQAAARFAALGPPWVRANRSYDAMIPKVLNQYRLIVASGGTAI